jgi:hypothetical protein
MVCTADWMLCGVQWGENFREHQVERLVPVYHKTNVTVYKVSSRVNSHIGQVMVVVWRKFGNVLRKLSSIVWIFFFQIKF